MSEPITEGQETAEAPTAPVRRGDGTLAGTVSLTAENFGITPNVAVMHQVVVAQLAAARAGTHSTKTRSEVRGGGSKPWRQKGTGRARQGSIRAPQWTGGGSVFGPRPRSYEQRTPKKMRRLALRSALSDRASEGRIVVADLALSEPKTRMARRALTAIGCSGRTLVVVTPPEATVALSSRNLADVQTTVVGELSAYDVLRSDWVVFTPGSLAAVEGVEELEIDRSAAEEAAPLEPEPERAEIAAERRRRFRRGPRRMEEPAPEEPDEDVEGAPEVVDVAGEEIDADAAEAADDRAAREERPEPDVIEEQDDRAARGDEIDADAADARDDRA